MRRSILEPDEFDRRYGEVFNAKTFDYYDGMKLYDDGSVRIHAYVYDDDGLCLFGFYDHPDMSCRPISVQYLMGDIDEYHHED